MGCMGAPAPCQPALVPTYALVQGGAAASLCIPPTCPRAPFILQASTHTHAHTRTHAPLSTTRLLWNLLENPRGTEKRMRLVELIKDCLRDKKASAHTAHAGSGRGIVASSCGSVVGCPCV